MKKKTSFAYSYVWFKWKEKSHAGFLTVNFNPQIIGVEDLESLDRLEIVNMLLWNLGNLKQS